VTEPFRLLVVCTANRCRSPMAERLAADQLRRRGVDAEVRSSGTMEGGVPATDGARRALARRGLDLSEHTSRQLDADTIEVADLIVTMERRHLGAVAELSIEAVRRSFPLKELAALAAATGTRPPAVPVSEWIARADRMRHPSSVLSVSTSDDVQDPMGGSRRDYRRTADELDDLLDQVFSRLFPAPAGAAEG